MFRNWQVTFSFKWEFQTYTEPPTSAPTFSVQLVWYWRDRLYVAGPFHFCASGWDTRNRLAYFTWLWFVSLHHFIGLFLLAPNISVIITIMKNYGWKEQFVKCFLGHKITMPWVGRAGQVPPYIWQPGKLIASVVGMTLNDHYTFHLLRNIWSNSF